jgi:hypothetical protein
VIEGLANENHPPVHVKGTVHEGRKGRGCMVKSKDGVVVGKTRSGGRRKRCTRKGWGSQRKDDPT